jgi:cytochrome c oxidase cbb3-type subunit 3
MSDENQLREHAYDGIQEYDNALPRWWVYKFWITIVFSAAYMFWFHWGGSGLSLDDSYREDLKAIKLQEIVKQNQTRTFSEEELLALASDASVMDQGKSVFDTRCATCHGFQGEGLVGPNLTDDYWIHGNRLTDFVTVIAEGIPAKGMVPWKGVLKQEEIHAAAVYLQTLHGTKPANAKGPEGDLIK